MEIKTKIQEKMEADLADLVSTSQRQRSILIKRFQEHQKKKKSINQVYADLIEAAADKLPECVVLGGHLKLQFMEPRPVTITYNDTGDVEEIVTIPQLALVGLVEVEDSEGNIIESKYYQKWVGRVFPQWRAQNTDVLMETQTIKKPHH